ncbi:MAG TPA: extracellular solute-binding protein [Alphaproteobacteria bacterium]|jgi:ABC-type Fe3+ transport system substrate-binding protein
MKSTLRLCRHAAAGLALFAFGTLPAVAAEQSPALKELIAAANKEGKVNLSWGAKQLGGNAGVKEITDQMNAMFGTKIVPRFTPAPNENENLNAILIAKNVNRPSQTDIFLGSNQHGALIAKNKLGTEVDWQALLPGRIQASSVEANGAAIRMYTVLPGGIIYNTQRAPSVPTNLTDLLKPEWKGKIASTPYASGFDLLSSKDVWGEERTLDFARKLSAQISGLMRCNEFERVASGEFAAYALDCTGTDWQEWVKKGMPIGHVIPDDFAAVRYNYMTVPVNAVNPHAAELLITFLHTPEGQKFIWNERYADLHTYEDGQMAKEIDEHKKRGVVFHEFTIDWYTAHPEIRESAAKVVKIMSTGR